MKARNSKSVQNLEIHHDIYNTLGDQWYTADDNPIAMLRAVSRSIFPWIINHIKKNYGETKEINILDIGCGGGFLTNPLAKNGYQVTGIDLSKESLEIAKKFDSTHTVHYLQSDAHSIPFTENQFDIITCLDFLEHVENPALIIAEATRILKPGGYFFFHTFNRNIWSEIVVIKLMEWFIKNTPKKLHIKEMFITTDEIQKYIRESSLQLIELKGLDPKLDWKSVLKFLQGEVSKDFKFVVTNNLLISYIGLARK